MSASGKGMSLRSDFEFARNEQSFGRRWVTPITVSLAFVSLTTAFLWIIQARLQQEHLIFIYFVPLALIAIRFGSVLAMCVTLASSLAAAYFLYAPKFSFLVTNPLDLMELVLFGMLALLASQVVAGFANDRTVDKRRRRFGVPLRNRPLMAALRSRFWRT